jgi:hypothetical protein
MTSSARAGRVLAVGAICLLAIVAVVWWRSLRAPEAVADANRRGPVTQSASVEAAGGFQLRLLPDGGVSAQPASVRIGLAAVSPDDDAGYRAWLRSGREGAGPREYRDLASVQRWINAPARLLEDGSVQVGPMPLPAAQRYVVQARADDGLRFYEADFVREDAPATVLPRVAAALRVRAPNGINNIGVLFRRVEGSQDAAWQSLLRREAVNVIDAFDERAIAVENETRIAPLPTGPLDVVAVIDGVETERRRVTLVAGRETTFDLDPGAAELGAALATTVILRLVEAGTRAPVREGIAVWPSPRGELRVRPDAAGLVRLPGADASEAMTLELRFEPKGPPSFLADTLPRWPERVPLRFDLSQQRAAGGVVEKTVELQPLRWLIVETPGIDVPKRPRVGDPFPVFVLQRAQGDGWRDVGADYFRPVDEGVVVSLDTPGRVRVAALLSPWQLAYSDEVESRPDVAQSRTRLRGANGRTSMVRLVADAKPLAFAPVQIVSPLRGVPPKTLTTDRAGRIVLPNATVSSVRVEVSGYEQVEVRLAGGEVVASLQREGD